MLDFLQDPFANTISMTDHKPPTKVRIDQLAMLKVGKDFFDQQIAIIRAELSQYETACEELTQEALEMTITGPKGEAAAVTLGSKMDALVKEIERRRKSMVEEPNQYVKSINNLAKVYQEKLNPGITSLKGKLSAYAYEKRIEAQRKAEAEAKARAELQAKIDAETARLNAEAKSRDENAKPIEAPKIEAPLTAEPPKTTRTEVGKATQVTTWAFNVVDPAKVPAEYLVVDEKRIRQAVKDGIRQIPGVEIFEETKTRFGR